VKVGVEGRGGEGGEEGELTKRKDKRQGRGRSRLRGRWTESREGAEWGGARKSAERGWGPDEE